MTTLSRGIFKLFKFWLSWPISAYDIRCCYGTGWDWGCWDRDWGYDELDGTSCGGGILIPKLPSPPKIFARGLLLLGLPPRLPNDIVIWGGGPCCPGFTNIEFTIPMISPKGLTGTGIYCCCWGLFGKPCAGWDEGWGLFCYGGGADLAIRWTVMPL